MTPTSFSLTPARSASRWPPITAESLLSGSSTSRVSYEHTWWQDATFNKPAAASLFSYIFRWQDDVVKVDFTAAFNPPPLASQRGKIRRRCRRIDIAKPVTQMERATRRDRCRLLADSVAKVPKAAAAKFSPKNETSDNRRSIEPQTRCQNRL
jgi:hypothetical protein